MTIGDLKQKIEVIDDKLSKYKEVIEIIDKLKNEKTSLKKKLSELEFEELPFEKKFERWLNSSSGTHLPWLRSVRAFPALFELMDDPDYNRYETINFREKYPFDEMWECIIKPNGREIADQNDWDYELILRAGKEVVDNNLKSFKNDW